MATTTDNSDGSFTISSLVDVVPMDDVGGCWLIQHSTGMKLQHVSTLAAAQTRAGQMVDTSEITT